MAVAMAKSAPSWYPGFLYLCISKDLNLSKTNGWRSEGGSSVVNRMQSDCLNIGTISSAAGQQLCKNLMWSWLMCVVIKMAIRRFPNAEIGVVLFKSSFKSTLGL